MSNSFIAMDRTSNGYFFFDTAAGCLPLALNDQALGPQARVIEDQVNPPTFAANVLPRLVLEGENRLFEHACRKELVARYILLSPL